MVKSPIEYFEEQVLDTVMPVWDISIEEQRFLQKYVGLDYDTATLMASMNVVKAVKPSILLQEESETLPKARADSWDTYLKDTEQSALMSFYIGEQLYAVPALAVQEVLATVEPTKIPMNSSAVVGIINFRSRLTPLLRLTSLFAMQGHGHLVPQERSNAINPNDVCIICQCCGMQFGLLVERVHAMHEIFCKSLEWDVGITVGIDTDCIAALYVENTRIVPVLSLDRIVTSILYG